MNQTPLRRLATLGTALTLLVAAACDTGDDSSAGGAQRATGTPIVVGLINQEDAPAGSFPEFRRQAESAVEYVNNDLNGVAVRPIKLETCVTNGSPESSQACANRLRDKSVVAVIGGVDLGAGAALTVLEQANIPYIGTTPALGDELTSDGAFLLTGGTAADLLGAAAYLIDTLKVKKVGIIYFDLPGLLSTAVEATKQVLTKKGVEQVKLVAAKPDARDLTPPLSQVSEGDPDVIVSVFPAQGCARIMQAKQSLDLKAKMVYPGACADEAVLDTAGRGAEGAYFASGFLPWTDEADPDVATYRDHSTGKKSVLAQGAFAAVMDLRAILTEVPEPITPAALGLRLDATKAQPGFMSHPYTCDGNQVVLLTAICNANVRVLSFEEDKFTDVTGAWVNGADLIKLFTT